jgi:hypothetical protein
MQPLEAVRPSGARGSNPGPGVVAGLASEPYVGPGLDSIWRSIESIDAA